MARRFEAFVIFAEMRTGSNHLEESLNGLADIECHGEVFNPTFIGHHNRFEFLGYDLARRERDPVGLVDAMIARGDTLPGFRFFHDHDPRVLDRVLNDPRIAKVLLTRNPLDSYVSRRIATETGQWRLTDLKHSRSGKIDFDGRGVRTHAARLGGVSRQAAPGSSGDGADCVPHAVRGHKRCRRAERSGGVPGIKAQAFGRFGPPETAKPGRDRGQGRECAGDDGGTGADRPVRPRSRHRWRGAARARRLRFRGASGGGDTVPARRRVGHRPGA
jgi:hypothetical protein